MSPVLTQPNLHLDKETPNNANINSKQHAQ
jgi:hypothetical protein